MMAMFQQMQQMQKQQHEAAIEELEKDIPPDVEKELDRWEAAKRARDFQCADKIRAELRSRGFDADLLRGHKRTGGNNSATVAARNPSNLVVPVALERETAK